jgi:hypothetical protein
MADLEIFTCDQGSEAWFAARLGIPTSSKFATVMAKGEGKTRTEYMRRLAGEIITGLPSETYSNDHMARGQAMEDEARERYAFDHEVEPVRIGFARRGAMGCSPDSLISDRGGLEIKTALPHILIEHLDRDDIPPVHRAQIQGNLMVLEREWWDLSIYWPRMPRCYRRTVRDEAYIANLRGEIDRFNDELAALVERVSRMGHTLREAA